MRSHSCSRNSGDNQMKFNPQTKVIADGTTTDGTDKVTLQMQQVLRSSLPSQPIYKDEYPKYRTGESAKHWIPESAGM